MHPGTAVDIAELLALRGAARDLRLRANKPVRGARAGNFVSPLRGRGLIYEETRGYQPGDDTRHIDWRVTARTDRPHTKLFREERERPVWFVLDQGVSMQFATRVAFKSVIAARLAALLAWSARAQGDRTGAVVFDDHRLAWSTPHGGDQGVIRCLRLFAQAHSPIPCGGLADALRRTAHAARPGSLIYVFSDFVQWSPAEELAAQRLAQHGDVVLIRVYDPLESAPPPAGVYGLTDGHSHLSWDTSAATINERYSEEFLAFGERLRAYCRRHRMTYLEQCTTTPLERTVAALATARGSSR